MNSLYSVVSSLGNMVNPMAGPYGTLFVIEISII